MTVGRPRTVSDEQILAGAARVIARVGPARLTLAEVGREVGLAAPTLTQRFKTKRGLLLVSPGHLSRSFRAAVGDTPYNYFTPRRIERADPRDGRHRRATRPTQR